MRVFALLSLLAVITLCAMPAQAQEVPSELAATISPPPPEEEDPNMQGIIAQCGTPMHSELNTDKVENLCDIYSRQIGYYDEQKQLKDKLRQRQANFYAPHREAKENYKRALDAHWAKMGAASTGGNQ